MVFLTSVTSVAIPCSSLWQDSELSWLIVSAEGDSTIITANPDVEPEEPCIEESILPSAAAEPIPTKLSLDEVHAQTDLPDVTFRFSEKKRRLNWSNKACMWSLSDTLTRDKQIPPRSRTVDYRRNLVNGTIDSPLGILSTQSPALYTTLRHIWC